MAVKWETVKAGDVLYNVRSGRAGNTTLRTVGVYDVRIRSIDHESGRAVVSWNGNRDETWYRHQVEKLRRNRPKTVTTWAGTTRLARRGESGDDDR